MTGTELRKLRHRMGWTNLELAYRLGVTERAVYRWQSGDRKITSQVVAALSLLGDSRTPLERQESSFR